MLANVILIGVTVTVVFLLVSKIRSIHERGKANHSYAAQEIVYALSAARDKDWSVAISHLCLSIGRHPSDFAYNILGVVWGYLGYWARAGEAFRDARNLIYRGGGIPRIQQPETFCMLIAHEAYSYARASNWEFALHLSDSALGYIREGLLLNYTAHDFRADSEKQLRLVRMVVATQLPEKDETIYKAEALWIMDNTNDSGYTDPANIVLDNLNDFPKMRTLMLEHWLKFDDSIIANAGYLEALSWR